MALNGYSLSGSPSCLSCSPCPCSPGGGEGDAGGLRPCTPTSSPHYARPNTSPHINKFLAREPPSGSKRVALRVGDDRFVSGYLLFNSYSLNFLKICINSKMDFCI